ncbi:MAG: hypothetical protein ABSH11_09405 [Verrucomicrobiota bacterium]
MAESLRQSKQPNEQILKWTFSQTQIEQSIVSRFGCNLMQRMNKRIVVKPERNFNANSDRFYLTRFGAPKQPSGA